MSAVTVALSQQDIEPHLRIRECAMNRHPQRSEARCSDRDKKSFFGDDSTRKVGKPLFDQLNPGYAPYSMNTFVRNGDKRAHASTTLLTKTTAPVYVR